jgi:hypothetical protein
VIYLGKELRNEQVRFAGWWPRARDASSPGKEVSIMTMIQTQEGLPEFVQTVQTQRMDEAKKREWKYFTKCLPTEALREDYWSRRDQYRAAFNAAAQGDAEAEKLLYTL